MPSPDRRIVATNPTQPRIAPRPLSGIPSRPRNGIQQIRNAIDPSTSDAIPRLFDGRGAGRIGGGEAVAAGRGDGTGRGSSSSSTVPLSRCGTLTDALQEGHRPVLPAALSGTLSARPHPGHEILIMLTPGGDRSETRPAGQSRPLMRSDKCTTAKEGFHTHRGTTSSVASLCGTPASSTSAEVVERNPKRVGEQFCCIERNRNLAGHPASERAWRDTTHRRHLAARHATRPCKREDSSSPAAFRLWGRSGVCDEQGVSRRSGHSPPSIHAWKRLRFSRRGGVVRSSSVGTPNKSASISTATAGTHASPDIHRPKVLADTPSSLDMSAYVREKREANDKTFRPQ